MPSPRPLVFAAVLSCLPLLPATGFAAPSAECKKMCAGSERECAKNCEKDDPDCKPGCKENAKGCLENCEAIMQHKGNPAAMGEAYKRSYMKQKARESAAEEREEAGHQGHQH